MGLAETLGERALDVGVTSVALNLLGERKRLGPVSAAPTQRLCFWCLKSFAPPPRKDGQKEALRRGYCSRSCYDKSYRDLNSEEVRAYFRRYMQIWRAKKRVESGRVKELLAWCRRQRRLVRERPKERRRRKVVEMKRSVA